MALIRHNKRFPRAAVGVLGSTHDSRLLRSCDIYDRIEEGSVLPNTFLRLRNYGTIPFTTVGDSAIPRQPWLLKPYDENSCKGVRERYVNRRTIF